MIPPIECKLSIWERRLVSRGDWRQLDPGDVLKRRTLYRFYGLLVEQFEIYRLGQLPGKRTLQVVWRVRDTGQDNTLSVAQTFWECFWTQHFDRRCIAALQQLIMKMVSE